MLRGRIGGAGTPQEMLVLGNSIGGIQVDEFSVGMAKRCIEQVL